MEFISLGSVIDSLIEVEFPSMYLAMDTNVDDNGTLKDAEKKLGPVVFLKKKGNDALFLSCDTTQSPPYLIHQVPINKAYVFSTGKPHTKKYGQNGQNGGQTRKGKRSSKKTLRRRR